MRLKPQVQPKSEVNNSLIAREFMIGAGSAIAGDAIARSMHNDTVHHAAQEMGIDLGPNVIFPLAFISVMLSIKIPILLRRKFSKRRRRIHHIIVRSR